MKTVLITGASSGIGKETAKYFSEKGWNVIATMRSPEKELELNKLNNVKCLKLDVTDDNSIKEAINISLKEFAKIDVIVNNAGYSVIGAFEAIQEKDIRSQFDVNVFGLMNVTRNILPHFRENKEGIIINVSSVGGRITFPIYSAYHASKWAVEGLTESMHYEMRLNNIKMKLIEPGLIKTDFYERSQTVARNDELKEINDYYMGKRLKKMKEMGENGSTPLVVAKTIYKAATDNKKNKIRYKTGKFAGFMLSIRKLLPVRWFMGIIKIYIG